MKTKIIPKTNIRNINTAHTGKGKKSVCKPKADSEGNERFRRTGFGSETQDIVYRNRKGIAGRTMFAPTDFRFQCSAGGVPGGQDPIRFSGAFPCAGCPFQQEINRIAPVFHISFNSVWKTRGAKKVLSQQFICSIEKSVLWNPLWRIVE